jgi:hypothetical protein
MQTAGNHAHLALARTKFKPFARVLNEVSKDFERDYGRSAVLQQKSPMRQVGQSTCAVQYALLNRAEDRLSLTFIVVGDEADCVLLQHQERSGALADPGQIDQRVYELEKLDEIKTAVRERISAHLRT